jgi:hypothetical protein
MNLMFNDLFNINQLFIVLLFRPDDRDREPKYVVLNLYLFNIIADRNYIQ